MTPDQATWRAVQIACCLLLLTCRTRADDAAADISLIDKLLAMPVPAPDWRRQLSGWIKEGWTPSKVEVAAPAEDAPAERLAEFWSEIRQPEKAGIDPPNAKVVARLIEHCESFPGLFSELEPWFDAKKPEVVARIRSWHAKMGSATEEQRKHKEAVQEWLILRAADLKPELIARARKGLEDSEKEKFLLWLCEHDWPAARSLLLAAVETGTPAVRCHALRLLYKNEKSGTRDSDALRESWRSALRQIVESPGDAMVKAKSLEALASLDWPGRTDWIMTLFNNPVLTEASEGYTRMEPLSAIVSADPDYWIPRIVPLVGSRNRAEHDNVVRCLVQFHLERARADALKPLLPWLSDPAWASTADDYGRLRLIQSMERVDLPESVPGLMWVAEHDNDFALSGAADALAHYKAKQAVTILKSALSRTADVHHRSAVMRALIGLGGYSAQEMCEGIAAYAAQISTQEGRREVYRSHDLVFPGEKAVRLGDAIALGMVLAGSDKLPEEVSRELLRKSTELRSTQPKLAAELDRLIVLSATPEAGRVIVDALRSGQVEPALLYAVLSQRELLRDALKGASGLKLAGRTLQSLLSDDAASRRSVLQGPDVRAAAMLCAIARLGDMPLPVDSVASLLDSKDELCARAAALFLEADDGPEARKALLQRHQGKTKILGIRQDHDPGHVSFRAFDQVEEGLQERIRAQDGWEEIYAVLSAGYWGGAGHTYVLVKSGKATLLQDQEGGRQRSRYLTADELTSWKRFVEMNRIDDLAPLNQEIHDGIQYEYVHLRRDGGRRVFMNNPPRRSYAPVAGMLIAGGQPEGPPPEVYGNLVDTMHRLVESGTPMKVDYSLAVPVPGLKLVLPLEEGQVAGVVQFQDSLAVCVKKRGESRPSWRRVVDGKVGPDIAEPMPEVRPRGYAEPDDEFSRSDWLVNAPWRTRIGTGTVEPATRRRDSLEGLWIFEPGREPKLLVKGTYANPIVTPDGRWIAAAKCLGTSWADPNIVVRYDTTTGMETPLAVEPAQTFNVVAWVAPWKRMLLHRADDHPTDFGKPNTGKQLLEHRLLDPSTGATEVVTGEFTPFHQESWRPLQAAGSDGKVWAAIPVHGEKGVMTQFGRYDLRKFAFELWLNVPGLYFESMSMWVDEGRHLIYAAVNGDLITLPPPGKPAASQR